jgi:hypothetical protein
MGSTACRFRGVLFPGDAVTRTWWGGFGPARRGSSDDARLAAQSLVLWERLPPGAVCYVCTAHGHCSGFTPSFLRDVAR